MLNQNDNSGAVAADLKKSSAKRYGEWYKCLDTWNTAAATVTMVWKMELRVPALLVTESQDLRNCTLVHQFLLLSMQIFSLISPWTHPVVNPDQIQGDKAGAEVGWFKIQITHSARGFGVSAGRTPVNPAVVLVINIWLPFSQSV
jgi:hypothetical protein